MMHDLLFGLRSLRRSPGFTCVAVLTLALGIGVNTALFSVVQAVLLQSFGYADPARLVQIPNVSIPDFRAFQARARSFQLIGTSRLQTFTLIGPREPENLYGQLVSPECFAVLGAQPLMGRVFAEADFHTGAPPVALVSHKLWQRAFEGDRQIVGRRILLNAVEHTVIGVMPAGFQFPHPAFHVWAPWRLTPEDLANRTLHSYTLFARLRPGLPREAAQRELTTLSQSLAAEFPATNKDWRAVIEPLHERFLGGLRPVLYTLLGAVAFVLLIACMNVANLLMARGVTRAREIAIRTALGASRLRLVRQLLTESLLIAAIGGAIGLLFARWWLQVLVALLPARTFSVLPGVDQAVLDARVFAVSLLATLAAGIAFGLFPALRISATATRPGATVSRSRFYAGLIVVEAALSVILLAGSGLLLRSLQHKMNVDPGFRPEHVLTAQIPSEWNSVAQPNDPAATERRMQYFREVVNRIQTLPGVTAAGLTTVRPLGAVQINTRLFLQGRPEEQLRLAYRAVSPDYFRAMGIPLLSGRTFSDEDRVGRPGVVVVSEAFARRYWPNEEAIGKQITLGNPRTGPWSEVVGVAPSVRYENLTKQPEPELYTSYRQTLLAAQVTTVVLRTGGEPAALAQSLRAAIREINPNQPISEVKTLTEVVSESVALPRLYGVLLAIFAGLALVLAAAGIFSVVSWTVSRATREIGIRMALGATHGSVIAATMRRAMAPAAMGCVAGLGGAAGLTGFLKSQLYGVTRTDPVTFGLVPLVLMGVACLAAYVPARRAARVDPMAALRSE